MKKIYTLALSLMMGAAVGQTCFTYTSTNYPGSTNPWYATIDDFNNDGKKDFAANNFAGNSFNVYMGVGAGSFTQAPSSPYNTGANCFGITSGDFTNDGNKDIIVTNTGYFRLYVGNGAGTFTTSGNVSFPSAVSGYGAIPADFNNDGKLDVAFANNTNNLAYIYSGNGAGVFTQFPGSPYTIAGTQWWVEKGDFNGDGNMDLVYAQNGIGNLSVLIGTGTGSFTVNAPITGVAGAAQVSVGDVNNDGKLDLVAGAGSASANFYTCLGNGTGGFSAPSLTSTGALAAVWGAAIGDFNLDGNNDVFVSGFSSANSSVFYGNGLGGYTASTNSPFTIPGVTQNLHPCVGDLDGDNKPDVIVPNYGGSSHSVLLNKQINIIGTSSICLGASTTFTAGSTPTYTWNTGANTNTITVTPTVTTTYSVASFFNGCPTFYSKQLTVSPSPTVSAVSSTSILCVGQTATLTASGASAYVWNTTATTAVVAVSPTVTTNYTVTGTTAGCSKSFTISQTVSTCIGIKGLTSSNFGVAAYPNPNSGEFTVKSDVIMNISIVNELGQEVKTLSLNESNNYQSQVSALANGIYFMIGTHDQQVTRQRIVVAK